MNSRARRTLRLAASLVALAVAPLAALGEASEGSAGSVTSTLAPAIALQPAALYGGDIRSLVFDPAAPDRIFAGSSAGHVYRSDDGGSSWTNAGVEAPFPGWVVGSLSFDPDRPKRLWAALWGIWGGGQVAFSEDLGRTWELRPLGAFAVDQVYALARPSGRPERLVLGTRGGVLVSDDGGASFRAVGREVPGLVHVSSLWTDRAQPERIVAGTWRRAFKSEDGGATWRGIFDGMFLDSEVFSLSDVPGQPGELWASSCGWVYHGEQWGERWKRHQNGLTERRTPSFRVISPERLIAGTVAGAFLSSDGGNSFRRTSPATLSIGAIAHHPARPDRIVLGTEGSGIWVSADGGESFTARPVGLRNVRVPAIASLGDQVFAALAHAGPASGVYRSPDGGVSFEPSPAELPTVLDLAVFSGGLVAATERGLFERIEGGWRRIAAAGERRIERIAATDSRLALASAGTLYESTAAEPRTLRKVALGGKTPRGPGAFHGVALTGDELWVLGDEGLFRLSAEAPVASSLPYLGGRLTAAGGELVLSGEEGLYRRDARSLAWLPLKPGPARALPTGDARFPLVAESAAGLELYDRELGLLRAVAASFPAYEALSARVVGGRLLIGTSGYGLWEGRLPE